MGKKLYEDIYFSLTNAGEILRAKQNNGFKNGLICAIPFIDNNKYILKKYHNDPNSLKNITVAEMLNNVILLLPPSTTTYKQEYGTLTYTQKPTNVVDGLETKIYFNKDEDSLSYSTWLYPKQFSITDFNEDIKIDGIIYISKEYKSFKEDTTDLENDTNNGVPFAIAYLYGDDKLEILHDQKGIVVFDFEYCAEFEKDKGKMTVTTEYNNSLLHITDDGLNTSKTTLRDSFGVISTKNKILMSNSFQDNQNDYESYSKLNIMNRLDNKEYPQLTLQYASDSNGKSWDGRRVEFIYTSGDVNNSFSIREVAGQKQDHGANFHLFSNDNNLNKNTFENGFIYSRNNKISSGDGNLFVNSDDNKIDYGKSNLFTNAKNNTLIVKESNSEAISGIAILNAKNNTIEVSPKKQYKNFNNINLFNTDDTYLHGGTNSAQALNLIDVKKSYINTPANSAAYSQLILGGKYNYINNSIGNEIFIGNGLETINSNSDHIIIGNYNDPKLDEGDIFVIANGIANSAIENKFIEANAAANTPSDVENNFFKTYSGNSNAYVTRHNLFTVNKNGSFKINGNDKNNVEFTTSGIHAYNDTTKETVDIIYKDVYNKINVDDVVYLQMQEIDKMMEEYQSELSKLNRSFNYIINGDIGSLNDATSDLPLKNNDILNVNYINKSQPGNTTLSATIQFTMSGDNGFGQRATKIVNGDSQSFLYVNDTNINMTGFSKIV